MSLAATTSVRLSLSNSFELVAVETHHAAITIHNFFENVEPVTTSGDHGRNAPPFCPAVSVLVANNTIAEIFDFLQTVDQNTLALLMTCGVFSPSFSP
jgi:hypothetical protein